MFLASSETPLQHKQQKALARKILENATELHKFKPILLGLGVSSVMTEINDEALNDLAGFLKKPNDSRQGQLLFNYDNFYKYIQKMLVKFNIDPPLLFLNQEIDRTALVYYNTNKKVNKHLAKIKTNLYI